MPGKDCIVHGSLLVFAVLSIFVDGLTGYGQENSRQDSEPFLFGGLSSVDRLSKNLESLTKVIDPQNAEKQVLAAIPESLDRTRPIGIFSFWGLVENPMGEIQWSMQFSPDGGTLISGGNGKVNVWDVSQSKLMDVQTLDRFANIQPLAISRDGKQFAVPIENGVQVFQLR